MKISVVKNPTHGLCPELCKSNFHPNNPLPWDPHWHYTFMYQAISFHTVFQSKNRMNFLFVLCILHLNLPGDSWSFTICLSVNCERLWMRLKQWLVLQLGHNVGSGMRPRSISTAVMNAQTMHLKKASLISGIMFDVRITMPLTVISWSISVNR